MPNTATMRAISRVTDQSQREVPTCQIPLFLLAIDDSRHTAPADSYCGSVLATRLNALLAGELLAWDFMDRASARAADHAEHRA